MKNPVIKVFGLPRSCTNVTEFIVKTNFKIILKNNWPCWKHGRNTLSGRSLHDDEKKVHTDDLKFIICTKHPHDWLYSLYMFENSTKHKKITPEEFLKGNSWHYKDTRPDGTSPNHKNAIAVFNELTKHWLEMHKGQNAVFQVKHEDIIANQILVLEKIEKFFDLERRNEVLEIAKKRINPSVKLGGHYEKRKLGFNQKQIDYINKKLDITVVKLAGYKI